MDRQRLHGRFGMIESLLGKDTINSVTDWARARRHILGEGTRGEPTGRGGLLDESPLLKPGDDLTRIENAVYDLDAFFELERRVKGLFTVAY